MVKKDTENIPMGFLWFKSYSTLNENFGNLT